MLQILSACLLTVIVETAIFYLAGFRDRRAVIVVVFANVLSNLALNAAGMLTGGLAPVQLLIGEAAVVISEFLIYAGAFRDANAGKLLALTLGTNAASYCLGLLLGY